MYFSSSFCLNPERLEAKFGQAHKNDSKLFLLMNLECNDTPTFHVDVQLVPTEQVRHRRWRAGRRTHRDEGGPWP